MAKRDSIIGNIIERAGNIKGVVIKGVVIKRVATFVDTRLQHFAFLLLFGGGRFSIYCGGFGEWVLEYRTVQ